MDSRLCMTGVAIASGISLCYVGSKKRRKKKFALCFRRTGNWDGKVETHLNQCRIELKNDTRFVVRLAKVESVLRVRVTPFLVVAVIVEKEREKKDLSVRRCNYAWREVMLREYTV